MHRIVAEYTEDTKDRLVIDLCLSNQSQPQKMLVFGYSNEGEKSAKWPLVIEPLKQSNLARIYWGAYEDNTVISSTNIFEKSILINALFTRFDHDTSDNSKTEYVYKIIQIDKLH